eukprot:scaffold145539_cov41-Prasinocladus_malaysianus.AAC.1
MRVTHGCRFRQDQSRADKLCVETKGSQRLNALREICEAGFGAGRLTAVAALRADLQALPQLYCSDCSIDQAIEFPRRCGRQLGSRAKRSMGSSSRISMSSKT